VVVIGQQHTPFAFQIWCVHLILAIVMNRYPYFYTCPGAHF
jgi:hypothetical protein